MFDRVKSHATISASGIKRFRILASLLLSLFCQALEDTIIATAIPRITDDFQGLDDVDWYGSAYLLTNGAFQLFYGKLYQILSLRRAFLGALLLFQTGSLIAGLAPSSHVLIVSRAVAGTGAAGITSGTLNIMAHVTLIDRRPRFVSLIGAIYGIASVMGPLVGGAFAERVTWRWNFYLDLPIGGAAAFVLLLALNRLPPSAQGHRLPFRTAIERLDPVGTVSFIPSIISLLMALQSAGTTYAWADRRIVALLTVFAMLLTLCRITEVQNRIQCPLDLGFQQPFLTVQTILPLEEVGRGTGVMMLAQLGGAAIFVSVALNVFTQNLVSGIAALGLEGVDPHSIVQLGATQLRQIVPPDSVDRVVVAYNSALVKAYQVGLIMSCISILGPASMKWVSLGKKDVTSREVKPQIPEGNGRIDTPFRVSADLVRQLSGGFFVFYSLPRLGGLSNLNYSHLNSS